MATNGTSSFSFYYNSNFTDIQYFGWLNMIQKWILHLYFLIYKILILEISLYLNLVLTTHSYRYLYDTYHMKFAEIIYENFLFAAILRLSKYKNRKGIPHSY